MKAIRLWVGALAALAMMLQVTPSAQTLTKYVRDEAGGRVSWGVLEGETIIRERHNRLELIGRHTGTPGAMKPGDTFEVAIPGVGALRNKIVAAKTGR
jgi:2-keto-4-pentenoate hydratase/2-oxohepta-3-ene-1,7-dioic acid hydratase in catechol pathway